MKKGLLPFPGLQIRRQSWARRGDSQSGKGPVLRPYGPQPGQVARGSRRIDDRLNNQAILAVRFVTATMREVAGTPLDISFFVGNYDKLGSGDEFSILFGTTPLGIGLRGFFYYPEGFNNDPFFRFSGAPHSVKGTGLAFKAVWRNFVPALYVYHDLFYSPEPSSPENCWFLWNPGSGWAKSGPI